MYCEFSFSFLNKDTGAFTTIQLYVTDEKNSLNNTQTKVLNRILMLWERFFYWANVVQFIRRCQSRDCTQQHKQKEKDLPLPPGLSAGVVCMVHETRKEGFIHAVGEQGGQFMAPGFLGFYEGNIVSEFSVWNSIVFFIFFPPFTQETLEVW